MAINAELNGYFVSLKEGLKLEIKKARAELVCLRTYYVSCVRKEEIVSRVRLPAV